MSAMGTAALHHPRMTARRSLAPSVAIQLAISTDAMPSGTPRSWRVAYPPAAVISPRRAFVPGASALATQLLPWGQRDPPSRTWPAPQRPHHPQHLSPAPELTWRSMSWRSSSASAASRGPYNGGTTTREPRAIRGADAEPGGAVFFATCHPGLEQVVARELADLGYLGVEPSKAGVSFRGRRVADGYAANLWLRSAIRVLVLLAEGQLGADPRVGVRGGQALYDMVYGAAPWHEVIPPGATFSVEPRLWGCTDISSTRLVWSRVKDAVCDSIRQHRREKPSPPDKGAVADVPLYVSCYRDRVRIFRDMSGESLHRRGYRDVMHRAALNEAAAAGVLALSGWREALAEAGDGEGLVLADPMCGSGTFLIEAALMARDIAPGFMRSLMMGPGAGAGATGGGGGGRRNAALAPDAWPFQRWDDYDPRAWEQAVEEARARVRPPWSGRLLGVDVHEGALSLAVRQAKKAGVYDMLELSQGDCGTVTPAAVPTLVVCNPPWGERLDGSEDTTHDGRGRAAASSGSEDDFGGDDGDGQGSLGAPHDDNTEAPPSRRGQARFGPAGVRSETWSDPDDHFLATAWRSLDGFLYRQCPGASATVVSGNPAAFRYLKLKPQSKHGLLLSGVDVRVAQYRILDAASRAAPGPGFTAAGARSMSADDADRTPAVLRSAADGEAAAARRRREYDTSVASAPAASAEVAAASTSQADADADLTEPGPASRPAAAGIGGSSRVRIAPAAAPSVPAAAAAAAAATSRRGGTAAPPPAAPQSMAAEYLDADDGYWVSD